MRRSLNILTAAGVSVAALTATSALHARDTQARDARAVERALREWYDASERHDSVAWVRAMLPTFFIFEDTTRLDANTLTRLLFGSAPTGIDRATLHDFATQVRGDVAWTSFQNDEVYTPTGAPPLPVRRYLETVVFRRVGGAWRMERYHATRINRPAPGP